ncbi:MAG: biotin/lipoyl-containing protein, partial [Pseudomonadota bacterium]|nr:biotin/lipoyl-containing protein [Pseudomonadota bacterium]
MGVFAIRLPDVGEGIAEAELVEWHVKVGDVVREDDVLAAVMTDKAAVEVPSSVDGTVLALGGEIGDMIAIGAVLIRIEVDGEGNESGDIEAPAATTVEEKPAVLEAVAEPTPKPATKPVAATEAVAPVKRAAGTKPLAAP